MARDSELETLAKAVHQAMLENDLDEAVRLLEVHADLEYERGQFNMQEAMNS